MKTTLNTYDIAHALKNDENANWSWNGAKSLAEYLEEMEEQTGEEMELDVVAIRCDFSEYKSLLEWADDYFGRGGWMDACGLDVDEEYEDEERDEAIRSFIQDNGQLIEFNGGIIVSSF